MSHSSDNVVSFDKSDPAALYARFADFVVTSAAGRGLPPRAIACALLAKSVSVLIDEDGEASVAELLDALAVRLNPQPENNSAA